MKYKKISIIAIGCLLSSMTAVAGPTTVKAAIDSTTMVMGNRSTVRVTVVKDKTLRGSLALPDDSLVWKVEIADQPQLTKSDIGNNREQLNYTFPVQVFEPGEYLIPGLKFVAGGDTVVSNTLSLKVLDVDVSDLEKNGLYDYKDVEQPQSKFWDFLPSMEELEWLWWTLGGLLLLALVGLGVWMYRRWKAGKPVLPFIPQKPMLPPYEEAVAALATLKGQRLWERGDAKAYYTSLTDIVRRYIYRRYGVGAMEMTSRQILDAVTCMNEVQRKGDLGNLLETADFVKFAKMETSADENEKAFLSASVFVEENKPVVEQPSDNHDNGKTAEEGTSIDTKSKDLQ